MNTTDIIYIEDNDIEAQIMSLGLQRSGINVLHLADLKSDSLRTLNTPQYQAAQALLIDAHISGDDGLEFICKLRRAGDTRTMFLITAGENPDPALLQKLDITYMQKPVNFNHIARRLQALTFE
jgi:DNA-binding response OmpR family regulator